MRKLLCVTMALAALGLGAAYCCLPADPISEATCEKIKKGMPEKEVIELLGPGQERVQFWLNQPFSTMT